MTEEKQKTEETASASDWAYSTDGESYRHARSREDAITGGEEVADGRDYYVAPVVEVDALSCFPSAEDILEIATERLRDEVWMDAEPFDVSAEELAKLDGLIAAWAKGVASPCFTIDHPKVETFRADDGTGDTMTARDPDDDGEVTQ